jgi:hypothetical protein
MPQSDPNAPPESLILSSFDGQKNTVQLERLGPKDLVLARNITLDDTGQVSRRRGYTLMAAGNAHSLFTTNEGVILVVFNGSLGVLHKDYSFAPMRAIAGSDPSTGVPPLAYVQVGTTVYYSGLTDSGKVDLDTLTATPWQGTPPTRWLSPVVNPTPTLPAIAGRMLGPPPNATGLAYFNGKIYLLVGRNVWHTDLYTYDYVDQTGGFLPFEAETTMIGAVGDGVYVGTEEGLWFMSPSKDFRPEKAYGLMKRVRVMDSPVIAGSMVTIPAELGNPPQVPPNSDTPLQIALMFMTTNGVCVASDGGQTTNLTESKYFFPTMLSASAMYRRQDGMNQYVAATQSGGQPSNNAAIGDYIDVTIIRGSAPVPPPRVGGPVPQSTSTSNRVVIGETLSVTHVTPQFTSLTGGVVIADTLTYTYQATGQNRVTQDGNLRVTQDGNQRVIL